METAAEFEERIVAAGINLYIAPTRTARFIRPDDDMFVGVEDALSSRQLRWLADQLDEFEKQNPEAK